MASLNGPTETHAQDGHDTPNGVSPDNGSDSKEVTPLAAEDEKDSQKDDISVTLTIPKASKEPKTKCCHGCMQDLQSFGNDVAQMAASVDCKGYVKTCCTVETLKSKFPISKWLPHYRVPDLLGDMIAGLTVGLTVIPQGLAYAQVAGLSPVYGLYSAFMGCFVYIFFGTSKDITLGPTAIMSLMTATFAASPVLEDATLAIVLCFLCGIFQLAMGIFSLGFLVDFIPYPCINSFTCAAAITIAFSQVKSWLGLKNIPREFIEQVHATFEHIGETNLYDFALGTCCMIILYILKRLKNMQWRNNDVSCMLSAGRKTLWLLGTGRNALVVVLASIMAGVFDVYGMQPFSLTDPVPPGLPSFEFPSFYLTYNTTGNTTVTWGPSDIMSQIGIGFVIVPLMGVVESIAIGNAFARVNNYKIDANQELIAIGAANIIGAFVSSYPVTGSFSRTAVNSQSGVKTPAGGIWTGALVILALAVLTSYFQYIPDAALAGVIIMAVLDMVSFQLLRKLWRVKRIDILPWLVTFILSFIYGVEWGIVAGVCFSLLLLLYPWARPTVKVSDPEAEAVGDIIPRNVMVIQLDQGLLFPGIEYVRSRIMDVAMSADTPRSVVLDVRHLANMDYTTVQGLTHMVADFQDHDLLIVFAGFQDYVLNIMLSAACPGFRHTETVEEAIQLIMDETGCDEDPRQSLLHPASASGNSLNNSDPRSVEVVAADVEHKPEPEQV